MTYNEETTDREITVLCQEAIEQIKKVDTDSDYKKKEIVRKLATDLEGKIQTETICIEVITQLRGHVSESFIRKCLDKKYKDTRHRLNAGQQNKGSGKKCEEIPGDVSQDQDENSIGVLNNEIEDEKLALQGAQEQEEEIIINTTDGQALVQRYGSGKDVEVNDIPNSLPSEPSGEDESSPLSAKLTDKLLEPILIKCPECKIKDSLILEKNCIIEQLEAVIKKSPQLIPADRLEDMNHAKQIVENMNFKFVVPFENLRKEMAGNNRIFTPSLRIIFNGNIDLVTGEVSSLSWEIRSD